MTRTRPVQLRAISLLLAIAAVAGALGYKSQPSSSSSTPAPHIRAAPARHGDPFGEAGGAVPAGTSVFDDAVPGVARLDPGLLLALRRAAIAAAPDGVEFVVDSGWRSPEYQERLLREAVAKYGSLAAAARWVATPQTSPHVAGHAVDLGRAPAQAWLAARGAAFGLCQIYANEPWHYELRPDASAHGCPPMYADPSQDPRLREG